MTFCQMLPSTSCWIGVRATSWVLLLCSLGNVTGAVGHAYLMDPPSRNLVAANIDKFDCPHCLNGGGPDLVKERAKGIWPSKAVEGSHGVCGDPVQNAAWSGNPAEGKFMTPTKPYRTFVEGQIITIAVAVSTHHYGHYEFSICNEEGGVNVATGVGRISQLSAQSCFDRFKLKRVDPEKYPDETGCNSDREWQRGGNDCQPIDPRHPERWYQVPRGNGELHRGHAYLEKFQNETGLDGWKGDALDGSLMHYWLPKGLLCNTCTLQWHWVSARQCLPDFKSYREYPFPDSSWCIWCKAPWATMDSAGCGRAGLYPEEFWNCADISIVANNTGTTSPIPSSPAPASSDSPGSTRRRRRRLVPPSAVTLPSESTTTMPITSTRRRRLVPPSGVTPPSESTKTTPRTSTSQSAPLVEGTSRRRRLMDRLESTTTSTTTSATTTSAPAAGTRRRRIWSEAGAGSNIASLSTKGEALVKEILPAPRVLPASAGVPGAGTSPRRRRSRRRRRSAAGAQRKAKRKAQRKANRRQNDGDILLGEDVQSASATHASKLHPEISSLETRQVNHSSHLTNYTGVHRWGFHIIVQDFKGTPSTELLHDTMESFEIALQRWLLDSKGRVRPAEWPRLEEGHWSFPFVIEYETSRRLMRSLYVNSISLACIVEDIALCKDGQRKFRELLVGPSSSFTKVDMDLDVVGSASFSISLGPLPQTISESQLDTLGHKLEAIMAHHCEVIEDLVTMGDVRAEQGVAGGFNLLLSVKVGILAEGIRKHIEHCMVKDLVRNRKWILDYLGIARLEADAEREGGSGLQKKIIYNQTKLTIQAMGGDFNNEDRLPLSTRTTTRRLSLTTRTTTTGSTTTGPADGGEEAESMLTTPVPTMRERMESSMRRVSKSLFR